MFPQIVNYKKDTINIACIKPYALKPPNLAIAAAQITPKLNFNFFDALESVYPLLDIVFGYLDYPSLRNACSVRKSWCAAAHKESQRRKRCKASTVMVYRSNRQYFCLTTRNYLYASAMFGFLFTKYYNDVNLREIECGYSESLDIEYRSMKLADIFLDGIPPTGVDTCLILLPQMRQITAKETRLFANMPIRSIYTGCFLPEIPGVTIVKRYYNRYNDNVRNVDLVNGQLKCLLFFSDHIVRQAKLYKAIHAWIPNYNEQKHVAFGGAVVSQILRRDSDDDNNIVCIAFLDNASVETSCFNAASLLLKGRISSETFTKEILAFKRRIVMRKNSVALLICCNEKDCTVIETNIFYKHFPDTILVSLDVNGEIGWSSTMSDCDISCPDGKDETRKKQRKSTKYPKIQHQWSSVIVLLTWGLLVEE